MRRTILVTGSSRGIGKAVAIALAQDGFDIVIHCRREIAYAEAVLSEVRASGVNGRILQFDIADRQAASSSLNEDIEQHGAYYGVVSNAGLHRDNAFPALTEDDWDQVIHTNLDGFYNVLYPVIMPMIRLKMGGRIVVLSSVAGITGNRGQVNYSASKAGLIGATKALAVEVAKRKITVNCVAPGIIETDMADEVPADIIKSMVPLRRKGTSKEVASLVSYLCSDQASYITRQVISVNGGMV